MKTTIDLPADLVREIKFLAVHEGRKLKDVAADLLKRGLGKENSSSSVSSPSKTAIKLPLFPSPKSAPASLLSTAELLALEKENRCQEDLCGVGLADCLLAAPAGAPPMTPERIKQILEETP
jgi:hypothetical protein